MPAGAARQPESCSLWSMNCRARRYSSADDRTEVFHFNETNIVDGIRSYATRLLTQGLACNQPHETDKPLIRIVATVKGTSPMVFIRLTLANLFHRDAGTRLAVLNFRHVMPNQHHTATGWLIQIL